MTALKKYSLCLSIAISFFAYADLQKPQAKGYPQFVDDHIELSARFLMCGNVEITNISPQPIMLISYWWNGKSYHPYEPYDVEQERYTRKKNPVEIGKYGLVPGELINANYDSAGIKPGYIYIIKTFNPANGTQVPAQEVVKLNVISHNRGCPAPGKYEGLHMNEARKAGAPARHYTGSKEVIRPHIDETIQRLQRQSGAH
jgi:hypothetical protein